MSDKHAELLKRLWQAGTTGCDLSPGDPLCLEAFHALESLSRREEEVRRKIEYVAEYAKQMGASVYVVQAILAFAANETAERQSVTGVTGNPESSHQANLVTAVAAASEMELLKAVFEQTPDVVHLSKFKMEILRGLTVGNIKAYFSRSSAPVPEAKREGK